MSDTAPPVLSWAYLIDHLASLFTALASIIVLLQNKRIHLSLNSRLSALIRNTRALGRASGRKAEREERTELDKRTALGNPRERRKRSR